MLPVAVLFQFTKCKLNLTGYAASSHTWPFKHGKFLAWNLLYSGRVYSKDWISENFSSQAPTPKVKSSRPQKHKPTLLSLHLQVTAQRWNGSGQWTTVSSWGSRSWIPIHHEEVVSANWHFSSWPEGWNESLSSTPMQIKSPGNN